MILKKASGSVLTPEEVEGVRRRSEEESGIMESASMEDSVWLGRVLVWEICYECKNRTELAYNMIDRG